MKKKKYIILMIIIVSVVAISIPSFTFIKSSKEKKELNNIQYLISNGNYEEALTCISNTKENEILTLYKDIITGFQNLNEDKNIRSKKVNLNKFKEDYKEGLQNDIFNKMNEDISKLEGEIKSYYYEVNKEKENILNIINEDINSATDLISKFKEKYPEEDIKDMEDKYNLKLEETNKKLKEEESRIGESKKEDKQVSNDNINSNSDLDNSNSKLGIANTKAAKNSSQIITVVSNGGSYGELVFWEKNSAGNWGEVYRINARLGQNGLKNASEVYEMDKSTPTGIYTLTEAFGINSNPGTELPYRKLDGSEYWVDDENSQYYNTMQFGEPNWRWNSAEKLIDYSGHYNYSIVIDYNRWPVVPGKSSAIFLHCELGSYTYGCVAIPQQTLVNILNRISVSKQPVIILDFTYEDIYNNY